MQPAPYTEGSSMTKEREMGYERVTFMGSMRAWTPARRSAASVYMAVS